jgi:hypothetical protein
VLAPAERADVLVDFTKFAGQNIVMKNHNPSKPGGRAHEGDRERKARADPDPIS